ncbi:PepSY-associated TM helix domain-containing protein [Pseudomonas sp. LRF_L74]|uniref:PepSY-associated TM helix domain-containing protein n=1 Tax=Pseudomonas sp. LRF_L74 TaxID=3369422 RepID=UPI003F629905
MSKVEQGVAQGGFRQMMAWLHTWGALWACWVLFVIFLTGTLGVFDEPITRWMKPEMPQAREAIASDAMDDGFDRPLMVRMGQAFLEKQAPYGEFWAIGLPSDEDRAIRVFWEGEDEVFHSERLDVETGEVLAKTLERETEGGHHFVHMHYEFHAGEAGIWLVGIFTIAMLVALVSGIVIHKRIFKDFFTFRPGKGQRSWLDAHNAMSVLSLPFQLMIAYTGLATFYMIYMPAGIEAHYSSSEAYFADLLTQPEHREQTGERAAMTALDQVLIKTEAQLQRPVSFVNVSHPGDVTATSMAFGRFIEKPGEYRLLGSGSGRASFDAVTGEQTDIQMPGELRGGETQSVQSVMANLHFAGFGGHAVRWLYFVCGMAGAAMMATGALLFMIKRRQRALNEFGERTAAVYRVIEILNIGTIAGLSLASIGFLWANRLIPLGIENRPEWEIAAFFALWILTYVHASLRPARKAWIEQLIATAALCLLLPLLNWIVVGDQFVSYLLRGDGERAGVELTTLLFGLLSLYSARHVWLKGKAPVKPRRKPARAGTAEVEVA